MRLDIRHHPSSDALQTYSSGPFLWKPVVPFRVRRGLSRFAFGAKAKVCHPFHFLIFFIVIKIAIPVCRLWNADFPRSPLQTVCVVLFISASSSSIFFVYTSPPSPCFFFFLSFLFFFLSFFNFVSLSFLSLYSYYCFCLFTCFSGKFVQAHAINQELGKKLRADFLDLRAPLNTLQGRVLTFPAYWRGVDPQEVALAGLHYDDLTGPCQCLCR